MKTINIKGSLRESIGKKDAKANRREGLIPCVIYGGENEIHVTIDERELQKVLITPNVYEVHIAVGDVTYRTVVQDSQWHPVSDEVLHVDFLQIFEDKPVVVSLPISTVGNSVGVRAGGKLRQVIRKLKVKGLPANLPETVSVDISKLDIGGSVRVKDLPADGTLEYLDAPNLVLVAVKMSRAAKAKAAQG